jgi:murein L,D-transpeptidase YafK
MNSPKASVALLILSLLIVCSAFIPANHFKLLIKKAEHKLYLYENDSLLKVYKIALGLAPIGRKEKRGDYKTPEGEYYISSKNSHSRFYLALGISYPNIKDAERGLKSGIILQKDFQNIRTANLNHHIPLQHTALGGEIFIHGNGIADDWTWGCVALEDCDIKELFDKISIRTPVKIEP